MYTYIYIYTYREREREKQYFFWPAGARRRLASSLAGLGSIDPKPALYRVA